MAHLPHQNSSRRFLREKVWSGSGNDREPESLEHIVTGELDREITSEAVGRLHDDGFRSVRREVLQHLSEAGALIDGVRAAHSRVVILPNDGEACSPGEGFNGRPLTFVAGLDL
jgi:hypothetical protein